MKEFQYYRDLYAGTAFASARLVLEREIVATRGLKMVKSALAAIQQQAANSYDDGSFWCGENKLPVRGLAVIGDSGSGKSFDLKAARGYLPDVTLPDGSTVPSKSLLIETPSFASMGVLANELVYRADDVKPIVFKDADAQGKALAAFVRHRFTVVIIDELSRMLSPNRYGIRTLAVQSQLMWSLAIATLNLNSAPTPLVVAGLPALLDTWTIADRKLEEKAVRWEAKRRFDVIRLPAADENLDGDLLRNTIRDYCAKVGVSSILSEDDMIVPRLIHAVNRQIGSALSLAQDAVALAKARPRGKLQIADFGIAYKLHTDAVHQANPFLVADFHNIDIGVVAPENGEDARQKEIA